MEEIDRLIRVHLTRERAMEVRSWRAGEEGATWRKVADLAHEAWGDFIIPGNQLYGEALCRLSAILLGEDPNEEPWN